MHKNWIGVGGFDVDLKSSLCLVVAFMTLVDQPGAHVAILWLNQTLLCPHSPKSLIAEDQLEHNSVEVHSCAKLFARMQCIIAKHPYMAKQSESFLVGMEVVSFSLLITPPRRR